MGFPALSLGERAEEVTTCGEVVHLQILAGVDVRPLGGSRLCTGYLHAGIGCPELMQYQAHRSSRANSTAADLRRFSRGRE